MQTIKRWTERIFGSKSPADSQAGSIEAKAHKSGDMFREWPYTGYFQAAEPDMDAQWDALIWPHIRDLDFRNVVDFAAGYGRNSTKLREVADHIIIVDINQECIEKCRQRFAGDERFEFIQNDGTSLTGIGDQTVSLLYSFDSMVHFEPEVVRAYMPEFYRVLQPGGHGFCHHSNYTGNPGGDFWESPHFRNYMSRELFAEYCREAGLEVLNAEVIGWGGGDNYQPDLDCLTLFHRPV